MNESMQPNHDAAEISTSYASRYLQQLCKHFGHKVPVTFGERTGQATFPFGTCHLDADDGGLRLRLEASNDQELSQLRNVVTSHLVRFAFREVLNVAWLSERADTQKVRDS